MNKCYILYICVINDMSVKKMSSFYWNSSWLAKSKLMLTDGWYNLLFWFWASFELAFILLFHFSLKWKPILPHKLSSHMLNVWQTFLTTSYSLLTWTIHLSSGFSFCEMGKFCAFQILIKRLFYRFVAVACVTREYEVCVKKDVFETKHVLLWIDELEKLTSFLIQKW